MKEIFTNEIFWIGIGAGLVLLLIFLLLCTGIGFLLERKRDNKKLNLLKEKIKEYILRNSVNVSIEFGYFYESKEDLFNTRVTLISEKDIKEYKVELVYRDGNLKFTKFKNDKTRAYITPDFK